MDHSGENVGIVATYSILREKFYRTKSVGQRDCRVGEGENAILEGVVTGKTMCPLQRCPRPNSRDL